MNSIVLAKFLYFAYANRLNKEVKVSFTDTGIKFTLISNKSRSCVTICTYNAEIPKNIVGQTIYISDVRDLLNRVKVSNTIKDLGIVREDGVDYLRYNTDVFMQSIQLVKPMDMYPTALNLPESVGTLTIDFLTASDIVSKMKAVKTIDMVSFKVNLSDTEIHMYNGGTLVGIYTIKLESDFSIQTESFAYDDVMKILSLLKKNDYLCIEFFDTSFLGMDIPIPDEIGTVTYYLTN